MPFNIRQWTLSEIGIVVMSLLCVASATSLAQTVSLSELTRDMIEYRVAADYYEDHLDRVFLSDMAVQNIFMQRSIYELKFGKSIDVTNGIESSYCHFVLLHQKIDSPCWAEWALTEVRTNFADFLSNRDSIADCSYSKLFDNIDSCWLSKYAQLVVYNEIVPARCLTFINLRFSRCDRMNYDVSDSNLIELAEQFLNRGLRYGSLLPITIFLPPGEYKLIDESGRFYPKEFSALSQRDRNEFHYLYLTPNMCFNFVPVAEITDLSDSSEALTPMTFELCHPNGDRVTNFNGVEYGRYTFKVQPPYELVDNNKIKLIIPYGEFGHDYLQRHSELFPKGDYEVIYVQPNGDLIYDKVTATIRSKPKPKHKRGW